VHSAVEPAGVPDSATDFFGLNAPGTGLTSDVLIAILGKTNLI
jgi:hypothetical protein